MMRYTLWLTLAAVAASAACGYGRKNGYGAKWDQGALDQKWTESTSQHYWWTSQGSQIAPYDYFTALELKDSQELFASSAHFDRLRYITAPGKSARNPGGLAIGFVKNDTKVDGLDVVGFTCAGCHTAKWKINGTDVLVEGGGTKGDAQTFLNELIDSMTQTIEQQDKFDRFAKRVGGDAAALKTGLTTWRDRLVARKLRNPVPADNQPGFGRIDALTNIVNEIASGDLGIPENVRIANAPVSVPHVWDAPQHDVVQWNGSIPNAGAGPALRNIGEVLGTFGTLEIEPKPGKLPDYPTTSAETKNLNAIEQDLWALSSPRWPEALVPIDQALASRRKTPLRAAVRLLSPANRSHQPRTPHHRPDEGCRHRPDAQPEPVATVKTGKLRGTPKMLNPYTVFEEEDSPIDVLLNAVFGAYMAHKDDFKVVPTIALTTERGTGQLPSLGGLSESLRGDVKQAVADFHATASQITQAYKLTGNTQPPPTNNYKARPLNGIWATGPFLHNGSVPTLAELLKTDSERVKEFYVGSWVLDPVNVGITSVPEEGGVKLYCSRRTSRATRMPATTTARA